MRARGEQLGDACGVETTLCEPYGCAKTCATGSYYYGIVMVIDEWVLVRIEEAVLFAVFSILDCSIERMMKY
ncbi:hypothetical protein BST61_g3353 [Cercospora zeina]